MEKSRTSLRATLNASSVCPVSSNKTNSARHVQPSVQPASIHIPAPHVYLARFSLMARASPVRMGVSNALPWEHARHASKAGFLVPQASVRSAMMGRTSLKESASHASRTVSSAEVPILVPSVLPSFS